MEKDDFAKYLKERYHDQVDWYDRKSIANQKFYRRFQWTLIVLASLTPILIGIEKWVDNDIMLWLPLITSFIVAIATAALKTFKYQENWIDYRSTCESLKHEKYLFLTGASPYATENAFALLVERIENLLAKENNAWSQQTSSGVNQSLPPTNPTNPA